jgi:hypothetical protein
MSIDLYATTFEQGNRARNQPLQAPHRAGIHPIQHVGSTIIEVVCLPHFSLHALYCVASLILAAVCSADFSNVLST